MKSTTNILGVLTILLFVSSVGLGQARPQADVQVRSLAVSESTGKLTFKFEIFNINDDSARNTTLRVLFPVNVKFLSSATGCTASAAVRDGTHAFAICDVGTLRVGESRTVQVVTTVPTIPRIRKAFGAFAWSETPDPLPANNYGEAVAP